MSHSSHSSHTHFPNPGFEFLSAAIHFIGVSILTYFLSCRLSAENLKSREAWARITWPRLCILLVILDSYLFILSAGLLIFGVGLRRDGMSCAAGIYLCVIFYTSSKVLIYAFLTEKVYIVWENGMRPRLRSPVYLICLGTVALYAAVILAMFFGRIADFRSGDGACVIGLKPTASLPLLSYDLYINILLTSLFLWPLLRVHFINPKLKRVATRTLFASIAALTTSTVNIAILTILHGRELGGLCLGSCGIDVILNAAVLFWVTSGRTPSSQNNSVVEREDSIRPGSPVSQRPGSSQIKPFYLRPKSVTPRPPKQFQLSPPPSRHPKLEPEVQLPFEESKNELPFEESKNGLTPAKELPFEETKEELPLEKTMDERASDAESKHHQDSDTESQKTLEV
ncbi:hypothetical protein B0H13DRAFT_2652534 [Mycena leptocephala]|nr:hypothetical protein B0H13DRAFT_2652534 [Mycena leptocephala]